MSALMLTNENFDEEVMLSEKPVLVDFFAAWCGPCRMVSPIVEQLSDELEDVKVCKIDVDAQPHLAERFSVSSIPTLMVFKNGKAVRCDVGARSKQDIIEMLK